MAPGLGIGGGGEGDLPNWVQDYEKYWIEAQKTEKVEKTHSLLKAESHANNARAFGKHIKAISEGYQISYIELDKEVEVGKACEIFTKINSKGIRLEGMERNVELTEAEFVFEVTPDLEVIRPE